mmetsp:Transcript_67274/g.196671  ORF Transcript_67274/g.196671 Transcript_67274/m.196671 type:complete len:274 (-) Transcript_67274:94-915(-)
MHPTNGPKGRLLRSFRSLGLQRREKQHGLVYGKHFAPRVSAGRGGRGKESGRLQRLEGVGPGRRGAGHGHALVLRGDPRDRQDLGLRPPAPGRGRRLHVEGLADAEAVGVGLVRLRRGAVGHDAPLVGDPRGGHIPRCVLPGHLLHLRLGPRDGGHGRDGAGADAAGLLHSEPRRYSVDVWRCGGPPADGTASPLLRARHPRGGAQSRSRRRKHSCQSLLAAWPSLRADEAHRAGPAAHEPVEVHEVLCSGPPGDAHPWRCLRGLAPAGTGGA